MLLQNRLNSINSQIKVYVDEIAKLQARVTQLQTHAQEVQGAEQAAESALAQIDTALAILAAICPDEINLFKDAIDAKFCAPLPQLQECADEVNGTEEVDVTPPMSDADENVIETIEAIVIERFDYDVAESNLAEDDNDLQVTKPEPEPNLGNAEGVEDSNGNGNGHNLLTYDELRIVDRPTLIKLANSHSLPNYKSKKRDDLASLLDGMVTSDEMAIAKNGKH